jgi:hypothetical protein
MPVCPPGRVVVVVDPEPVMLVVDVEVPPPEFMVVVPDWAVVLVVVAAGLPPEQLSWQTRQLWVASWACTSTILQSPVPLSGWHAEHLSAVTFLPGVPFG